MFDCRFLERECLVKVGVLGGDGQYDPGKIVRVPDDVTRIRGIFHSVLLCCLWSGHSVCFEDNPQNKHSEEDHLADDLRGLLVLSVITCIPNREHNDVPWYGAVLMRMPDDMVSQ